MKTFTILFAFIFSLYASHVQACTITAADNSSSESFEVSTACGSTSINGGMSVTLYENDVLNFDQDINISGGLEIQIEGNNVTIHIPHNLTVSGGLDITGSGSANMLIDGNLVISGGWKSEDVPMDISGSGTTTISGTMKTNMDTDCSGPCPTFSLSGQCKDQGSTYCEDHIDCGSGCSQPLPITLLYFQAEARDSRVYFSWATASELNNDYFTIEVSQDGKEFYAVQEVGGAGTSEQMETYQEVLPARPWPVSYYRLKQTDFDQSSTYSPVVAVKWEAPEEVLTVYPNPVEGTELHIQALVGGKGTLTVFDAVGMPVYRKVFAQEESAREFNSTLDLSRLGRGMYTIRMEINGTVILKKVLY
ncbi:T9SS type A sorting domain-containing protein [Rapidithrix thailandica]|uniref:T9SS type A sorting domain-containing protein n=1 Tax=Rapidithrix thailandica TaxID=413964 RepID=A0AAW9S0B7_9BACT